MIKIQGWLANRKCVRDAAQNASSREDILAVPTVMTPENLRAVGKYQNSLLPAESRLPIEGDVYVAIRDIPAKSIVMLSSAATSGSEGVIPAGTRIRTYASFVNSPTEIAAFPENHKQLEEEFVNEVDLRCGQYTEYYLYIETREFKDGLRLIKSPDGPDGDPV